MSAAIKFPSIHHLLVVLAFIIVFVTGDINANTDNQKCGNPNVDDGEASCSSKSSSFHKNEVPDSCRAVLAPIAENDWRVFSLVDGKRGTPVVPYGDVVHQLSDLDVRDPAIQQILTFSWSGQETGGQYEGKKRVDSLVPGLGMLARQSPNAANLLPFVPRVDEGGLTRQESPGAGSITHYHNYTIFFSKDVQAGDELVLPVFSRNRPTKIYEDGEPKTPTMFELLQTGYCLDNLRPERSRIHGAGRGAFATRNIDEGMVVAPVPVLPIARQALETKEERHQLLRNYCYGNDKSSTFLFPFGPTVNLINHYTKNNVRLQWPNDQVPTTIDESKFLMMELVAIKPISEGKEIYMDYGRAWEDAWFNHNQDWHPSEEEHYSPAYVMDDTVRFLRTGAEQKDHPYPKNVETSCFYRYSDRTSEEKSQGNEGSKNNKPISFRWKLTKGLFDLKNLRPCKVLKRKEDSTGQSAYVIRMFNRQGLEDREAIPKEDYHIITNVPRNAVRFTDKSGTTDQHLPGAFRHEINLKDDIFPQLSIEV